MRTKSGWAAMKRSLETDHGAEKKCAGQSAKND
jgi:hypothetical protein